MSTSAIKRTVISPTAVLAVDVSFSNDALRVRLSDGREVSVPLEWFPRLRDATPQQRAKWRLIARGIGIHWEDVDEDIAVTTLLRADWIGVESPGKPQARKRKRAGSPQPRGASRPPAKPAAAARRRAKALAGSRRSRRGQKS